VRDTLADPELRDIVQFLAFNVKHAIAVADDGIPLEDECSDAHDPENDV